MAKTKTGYEIEGEVVTNLVDAARLLGVDKLSRKDVLDGGQYSDQVSLVDLDDSDIETIQAGGKINTVEDSSDGEPETKEASGDNEDNWEEGYPQGQTADTVSQDDIDVSPEEIESTLPEFESLEEFKDFFKDLDTPTAEYIAKGLGLSWKPTDNPNIHRMRMSMALQRYLFPELFKSKESSKKSKYGDYLTSELADMAKENKVEWKESDNEPINRMRLIVALKNSGHLPK